MIGTELLQILQHTIGVDKYNYPKEKRNFFGTSPGSRDHGICIELVNAGLMRNNGSSQVFGDEVFFSVTPKGIDTVAIESEQPPEPVKMTAAQRRYKEYVRGGGGWSFCEWLGIDPDKARMKRLKIHLTGTGCRGESTTTDETIVTCKICLKAISRSEV